MMCGVLVRGTSHVRSSFSLSTLQYYAQNKTLRVYLVRLRETFVRALHETSHCDSSSSPASTTQTSLYLSLVKYANSMRPSDLITASYGCNASFYPGAIWVSSLQCNTYILRGDIWHFVWGNDWVPCGDVWILNYLSGFRSLLVRDALKYIFCNVVVQSVLLESKSSLWCI